MHVQFVPCNILPAVVRIAKTRVASTITVPAGVKATYGVSAHQHKQAGPAYMHACHVASEPTEAQSTVQTWQQDTQQPAQDASCSLQVVHRSCCELWTAWDAAQVCNSHVGRPCRDAQDRLRWRDKSGPACT